MRTRSVLTKFLGAAALAAALAVPAIGQETGSKWEISAQVRPRFEYRNGYRTLLPDPVDGVVFFSQRTRAGVLYNGEAKVKAFLQFQDVRTWGDETHTSNDATADKFDLHQGYVDLLPNEHWDIRIGRQEISYDEERLLGAGNWNQSGRSHDAVRVMWQKGKTSAHVVWAHHERGEPLRWSPYQNTSNYQDLALGRIAWASDKSQFNGMLVFDSYDMSPVEVPLPLSGAAYRWTGGLYFVTRFSGARLRGEGYYQSGGNDHVPDWDIRALMLGLSTTRDFGILTTTAWYDYLSGDDEETHDKYESFDPLYGTFHKFYGWADYFISFPTDTRGLGLQDLALKFEVKGPSIAKTQLDLHYFWLAETGVEIDKKSLGFEADLGVTIPVLKSVTWSGGASLVLPTETLKVLKGNADEGHWVWTMLDFNVK